MKRILLPLIIIFCLLFTLTTYCTSLAGWKYRKSIVIAHTDDAAQTNYQLKLLVGESAGATGEQVDCGGKVASDFDDLRFTTVDGTTLCDYWIESLSGATPNRLATVWIEIPSIAAHPGNTTIYIYYGTEYLFDNGYYQNILNNNPSTAYGEPTVITNSEQIDLWFYGGAGKPLYYCYSTDGINYSEPVPTDLPNNYKRNHILKVDSTYYLYVSDASNQNIYLYTGTNKINFTSQGIVLARTATTWDSLYVTNMFVWIENGTDWYMLYEAIGTGQTTWAIGLATSADGKDWTKSESNPVFSVVINDVGCSNPELARVGSAVIKYDGKYYMYYHSGSIDYPGGNVFRAYSTNLTSWTDEEQIEGIVVSPSEYSHGGHCLAEFQNKTYLWWSPSNQVDICYLNEVIENKTFAELLALPANTTPAVSNGANTFRAFEDFTGALNAHIFTVSGSHIVHDTTNNWLDVHGMTLNETSYAYYDLGAGSIDDFKLYVTAKMTGMNTNEHYEQLGMGVADNLTHHGGNPMTFVGAWFIPAKQYQYSQVAQAINNVATDGGTITMTSGTVYYYTLTRAGTVASLKSYSDSTRTTQVGSTSSITSTTAAVRYLMAIDSQDADVNDYTTNVSYVTNIILMNFTTNEPTWSSYGTEDFVGGNAVMFGINF